MTRLPRVMYQILCQAREGGAREVCNNFDKVIDAETPAASRGPGPPPETIASRKGDLDDLLACVLLAGAPK